MGGFAKRNAGIPERTAESTGIAILVVDDDAGKRMATVAVLEPLGLVIVEAASGEVALREVMKRNFAVILMDVQMPGMDGYETASVIRMRRQSEDTPIIFITSLARDEAKIPVAYASGAADFMFAPVVPGILRAKVSIFVDLFHKTLALEESVRHVTSLSEEASNREARTRTVLENIADGIVTITSEGIVESMNRAAADLFGYDEDESIGKSFGLMIDSALSPESPNELTIQDILALHVAAHRTVEWVGRHKRGASFPMSVGLSEVQLGDRSVYVACVRDVSEQRSYTEALKHRALHDDLTELPNRALFADRTNQAITVAMRTAEPLALMVLDLDGFKAVNDTHGHDHGDELLKLVGQRLVACLRDSDTVARLGGDEFGVLLPTGADLAGVATVVSKMQRCFATPFLVLGHSVEVGMSVGITLVPQHGDNTDDLLRRADLAMYDAKRAQRGFAMFATEQEAGPARRLTLISNLRECIRLDQLVLHYQPKIDLTSNSVTGVEALIRWNHPSGELMMPDAFMPEVERNELIVPITEWVMNEALRQLHLWRSVGHDLTMAVNIGARCLAEGTDLFGTAEELTGRWNIPREKLTFELTESALIDTAVPGMLQRLHEMDERLSIDDFGTGYSSLVYLQRLPVVELKIDRSFVTSLSTAPEDAMIVRAIIDLAHNLGVQVVAEGVEDEAALKILVEYGCDGAQGYFFSRPLAAAELEQWLASSPFGIPGMPRHLAYPAAGSIGGLNVRHTPVGEPRVVQRILEIADARKRPPLAEARTPREIESAA